MNREQEITDESWMKRVAESDHHALQVLYGRYAPFLHHLALRSLDSSAAEDIIQEVFLLVWTKALLFDRKKGSFRNWVLQLAHFRILNELRRRSHRPSLTPEQQFVIGEIPSTDKDPFEQTWGIFRANALQTAVDRLPESQRQVLRLAFFDELSHEEVAQTLGIPLGTAKGRIRLALRKLRGGLMSLVSGVLLLWGIGTTFLAYDYFRKNSDQERTLAFLTRPDVEVAKLKSLSGEITGVCSYSTAHQQVDLRITGLSKPEEGKVYRFWARWDSNWILMSDLVWSDKETLFQIRDARWSREPVAIRITLQDSEKKEVPADPALLEAKL